MQTSHAFWRGATVVGTFMFMVSGLKRTVLLLFSNGMRTGARDPDMPRPTLRRGYTISDRWQADLLWPYRISNTPGGTGGFGCQTRGVPREIPPLRQAKWRHHWRRRISLTQTLVPHLHASAPRFIAGLGHNGSGVAVSRV
ncbi:MAG: hypothetical protein AAF636_05330 [Pseudomonadota bacterium]